MKNNVVKEFDGPIQLGGVGGLVTETPHGLYTAKLPLRNGRQAVMAGICLERITEEFPQYPLTQVTDDIKRAYQQQYGNARGLPSVPEFVGGEVDLMIGIKYLRYHPKIVFQLPSGLTIYQSVFHNS